jgi:hypothetical protein
VLLKALGAASVSAREAVVALPDTHVICKYLEVDAGLSDDDLELYVAEAETIHSVCAWTKQPWISMCGAFTEQSGKTASAVGDVPPAHLGVVRGGGARPG